MCYFESNFTFLYLFMVPENDGGIKSGFLGIDPFCGN